MTKNNNINVLSEKTANMIAAGEVIERPASIIKELVENSVDANSTEIKVEVFSYGLDLIKVSDNGIGMTPSNLKKAFLRHATSKITDDSDLTKINTLGFRGEAIPAIASVSETKITSKKANNKGYEVVYLAGKLKEEKEVTINKGTIVEVRKLFFNTPARYKYLKSENQEKRLIMQTIQKLAIAYPSIRMELFIDSKSVFKTYGINNPSDLITTLFDFTFSKDLTVINKTIDKIRFEMILVTPKITRANKNDIYIFINDRPINNYILKEAVINGYHSRIMINRYPIAIIKIYNSYELVDVNIHPQKLEVKLANEYFIAALIEKLIKDAFFKKVHNIPTNLTNKKNIDLEKLDNKEKEQLSLLFEEENGYIDTNNSNNQNYTQKLPEFDYIATLGGTYLLFENKDGLYLMDQHAAAERIRYEYYYNVLNNPTKKIKTLLIPYKTKLNKLEKQTIKNYTKELKKQGLSFDKNYNLITYPLWLKEEDIEDYLLFLINEYEQNKKVDVIKIRDNLATSISCKGAIKANKYLSRNEISNLVKELRKCTTPYTCPHGRPTIILINYYEIEKMFKRIV